MKRRNGFVTNSFSSSFILATTEDVNTVTKYGASAYKVSELIRLLKIPNDAIKELQKSLSNYEYNEVLPFFICQDFAYSNFEIAYYDELVESEKKFPGCYITSSIDRDFAHGMNWAFSII